MARLTEKQAKALAWEFLRKSRNTRRIRNDPTAMLVTKEQASQCGVDLETMWVVSFPSTLPRGWEPRETTVSIKVDDAAGVCSDVPRIDIH